MKERENGTNPQDKSLGFVNRAIEDLKYKDNPHELDNWNQECEIMRKRNPAVYAAMSQVVDIYPKNWTAFMWGSLVAHRASREEALSNNVPLPLFHEPEVIGFQDKVKPIIERLSRYAEDPAYDGGLVTISSEEREAFIGRLELEHPKVEERINEILVEEGKTDEDKLEEIDELKETHPAYLGFAYMYLMVKDLIKNQNLSKKKSKRRLN